MGVADLRSILSGIANTKSGGGSGGGDSIDLSFNALLKAILNPTNPLELEIDVPTDEIIEKNGTLSIELCYKNISLICDLNPAGHEEYQIILKTTVKYNDKYYYIISVPSSRAIDYMTTYYYMDFYQLEATEVLYEPDIEDLAYESGWTFDDQKLPEPFLRICKIHYKSVSK